MEQKQKKSINHYIRSLHRDVGFFVVGLVLIYSISGIVLIYRDTGFLKHEVKIEKQLPPNMEASQLGKALHIKDFKVIKSEGELVNFKNGTYDRATGVANYSAEELPKWISKFNKLHKSSTKTMVHWFTTVFGISMLFLAISSFWMIKPGTRLFRREVYFAAAGILFAIILLLSL
jgi:hypothetical protein